MTRMLGVFIIDDGINYFSSKTFCSRVFAVLYIDFVRYLGDFFDFMYLNYMIDIFFINRQFRSYTNSNLISNRLNEHFVIIQINADNILNTDELLIDQFPKQRITPETDNRLAA